MLGSQSPQAKSMTEIGSASIPQRYKHLLQVMESKRFIKMEGLGNEVPFFICPYRPQEANDMEGLARNLANQLTNEGHPVLLVNLYDLSIEIMKARGIWEQTLAKEGDTPKDEFLELLQSVLDPEAHLVPAIAEKLAAGTYEILFLAGVGAVYPFIRSHTVLNNLQSTAKHLPTVLFFPGEYKHSSLDGSSLKLFGLLEDDNYYRAFNIYTFQP